jgi:hypothetical protein
MNSQAHFTSLPNSTPSQALDNTSAAEEKVTASIAGNQDLPETKQSAR